MDVGEYIRYYRKVLTPPQCRYIICAENLEWINSTYSNHSGKIDDEERVRMDECWIGKEHIIYNSIKNGFEEVIKRYSEDFPLFSVQHTTDFRINRYPEGGFMSSHVDNIHHSHGQQYGYPQVSALLYLNDDYEGGEFKVADKIIYPEAGSSIIFPSNFMFPHEAKEVIKGTRWSIVTWLM